MTNAGSTCILKSVPNKNPSAHVSGTLLIFTKQIGNQFVICHAREGGHPQVVGRGFLPSQE
jgi:hypothetical protein